MTDPAFITNQGGNTLLAALRAAVPDAPTTPGLAEAPPVLSEVCLATAFFTLAGFAAVSRQLEAAGRVRLLLGAEPHPEATRAPRRPGDPTAARFARRLVADGLHDLEAGMRRDRDRTPFTPASHGHARAMRRMLRDGKLDCRIYRANFLHAKATLLDGYDPLLVAGSSNLTVSGLTGNLELNLGLRHPGTFAQARAWFDGLWTEAEPYDLGALFGEAEREFPPHLIFLKMLHQLYGDELAAEPAELGAVPLLEFQRHGVDRAVAILREHGGVIVADEVGLGKTFVAGRLLEDCAKSLRRALLVCPAALRYTTCKRFLTDYNIGRFVDMVSYDELGRDRRLADARRPLATGAALRFDPEEYALVVVDEAHNYRTSDAPYRAEVLARLLTTNRKELVLLTATPVNNSLYDLRNLMRFFLRGTGALAATGILDYEERFREAARQDPYDLSPDYLYPVIDAVTVKRTRAFVRKHYANDTITLPDGTRRPVQFPQAVPLSVRYDLDARAPGLFDAVADALDPEEGRHLLSFARYAPDAFRRDAEANEEVAEAAAAAGLLRSGLLKRFESSAHAFRVSLNRMVREHDAFLDALTRGAVITSGFLREWSGDEGDFDALLASGAHADAADYRTAELRVAVERDRAILAGLAGRVGAVDAAHDPKLERLVEELTIIVAQARDDAATDADERRNRKVLIFSYFADTVDWLRTALRDRVTRTPALAPYRNRIAAVAGSALDDEPARAAAVHGFAPESSDAPRDQPDLYDLLVTTDVLAEGMNLQQCRHIVNYDLPWNPMRLVQRHGRVDRIGSRHPRVFLRTVFPANRLEALLALESRILRKLTQAARSIGVATPPLDGADPGAQVFAEIRRLAEGDAAFYDRGGTESAAQTGEEYRQRLRVALKSDRDAILNLPGHAGSGMRKGRRAGLLFCAEVETNETKRTFLRFVPAAPDWTPATPVVTELGTCLRLGDCEEGTPRHLPDRAFAARYAFWEAARTTILDDWDRLSDPRFLQPPVRRSNRLAAAILRADPPPGIPSADLDRALDILETPWPRREETLLRDELRRRDAPPETRPRRLLDLILRTGLHPATPPAPLPPITPEDVRLVCWLAIGPAQVDPAPPPALRRPPP